MASSIDMTFENAVRQALNEKLSTLIRGLAEGVPRSLEAYREQVGEIRGVRDAIKACDEARRLIVGDEPKTDALTRRRMATGGVV